MANALSEPQLPIDNIDQFVAEVQNLIENIVNFWDQLLIPQGFRKPLKDAWTELRPKLDKLDLKDMKAMRAAGLDGNQLKLKLDILSHIWGKFRDFGLSWLDDLLDAINDVLGSIPGAEALEELKKAIENLINLARRNGR